jgi:hypothetical protein
MTREFEAFMMKSGLSKLVVVYTEGFEVDSGVLSKENGWLQSKLTENLHEKTRQNLMDAYLDQFSTFLTGIKTVQLRRTYSIHQASVSSK